MNHTYHQTPTQTSKPLHISPVSVNHSSSRLPIVAQAEQLAAASRAAIKQPIKINQAQRSKLAWTIAIGMLTKTMRLVYDYLHDWCQTQRRAGNKTGVFPSRKYIGKQVGCHVSTVQRAFAMFRATGLLAVIERFTTHSKWAMLHKQETNMIELPKHDAVACSIDELLSLGRRKKRDPDRRKQQDEGTFWKRKAKLHAQWEMLKASGQD